MDNYVKSVLEYIKTHPGLTETEKIMYVYLDLGKRLKFDIDFFFGGKMKTREIYYNSDRLQELERCFLNNKIICKSCANILTHVLTSLGVSIETEDDLTEATEYSHVVNVVTPKDGSPKYSLDLQKDLMNIHFNSFTTFFGKSLDDEEKFIITPSEQKKMHIKLGYINDKKPYFDEYIDMLRLNLPDTISLHERIDIVLNNIEPYKFENVSYLERQWKHIDILNRVFDDIVEDPYSDLRVINFFTFKDNERVFNNGFYLRNGDEITVYYYDNANYKYNSYGLEEFALYATENEIYNIEIIPGLNALKEKIYEEKDKKYK